MVFHWGLYDSKPSQVSRTLLSILADLRKAVVWIVSVRPPFSYFSIIFTKTLRIVPSALITIGITVIFILHSFFFVRWQGLSTCLFSFFLDFHSMHIIRQFFFLSLSLSFFFFKLSLDLDIWVGFSDLFVSQSFVHLILLDGFWFILSLSIYIYIYIRVAFRLFFYRHLKLS